MGLKNLFGTQKDRIIGITDGVFAIAMTILVLEIAVPSVNEVTTVAQMDQYILTYLIPAIVMYLISFYLVATFWKNTTLIFSFENFNDKIEDLNLLTMSFVCLIPFSTGFLFEFWQFKQANIVFTLNIFIASLLYLIMFIVVFKNEVKTLFKRDFSFRKFLKDLRNFFKHEKHEDINKMVSEDYTHFRDAFLTAVRKLFYLIVSPVITSIISLIVAFINPYLCIFTFILVLIIRFVIKYTNRQKEFNLSSIEYEHLTDKEKKMYDLMQNI